MRQIIRGGEIRWTHAVAGGRVVTETIPVRKRLMGSRLVAIGPERYDERNETYHPAAAISRPINWALAEDGRVFRTGRGGYRPVRANEQPPAELFV